MEQNNQVAPRKHNMQEPRPRSTPASMPPPDDLEERNSEGDGRERRGDLPARGFRVSRLLLLPPVPGDDVRVREASAEEV